MTTWREEKLESSPNYCVDCEEFIGNTDVCPLCGKDYGSREIRKYMGPQGCKNILAKYQRRGRDKSISKASEKYR